MAAQRLPTGMWTVVCVRHIKKTAVPTSTLSWSFSFAARVAASVSSVQSWSTSTSPPAPQLLTCHLKLSGEKGQVATLSGDFIESLMPVLFTTLLRSARDVPCWSSSTFPGVIRSPRMAFRHWCGPALDSKAFSSKDALRSDSFIPADQNWWCWFLISWLSWCNYCFIAPRCTHAQDYSSVIRQ